MNGAAARTLGTAVGAGGCPWWAVALSLTQLLDALLVLDEQLDPGDVNV